jgi:hypothetical protein
MRGESGRAEGARVGARRRGAREHRRVIGSSQQTPESSRSDNGTSDNKTLPEYSPRPACEKVKKNRTARVPHEFTCSHEKFHPFIHPSHATHCQHPLFHTFHCGLWL